jgi:glutamyl-tRNA reductase
MTVNALVVGLNHRSAPLWIRERVAFPSWAGAARDVAQRARLGEALVLSTCNRVEVYGAADADDLCAAAERLVDLLAGRAAMPVELLRTYLYVHSGVDAARHLARVASGMDSMVLGETQIVAQLKQALGDGRADGVVGRVLERLVSTALGAAKRARAHLPRVSGVRSVAEAGVHALGGVSALSGASVVVVGAGNTATDLLRALSGARPRRLVLVNRTLSRALSVAAKYGAAVASWEALGVVVSDADVVFACTAVATPVIRPEHLEHGPARARSFVDLGVPRNVAASVAELPDTRVIDVDSLGAWQPNGSPAAEPSLDRADATVDEWVARFEAWMRTESVLPTIRALRASADAAREREVARTLARLGAVGERERAVVEELAARLVNKLLHHPLTALAGGADAAAVAESVERLFGLAEDAMRGTPGGQEPVEPGPSFRAYARNPDATPVAGRT